MSGLDWFEEVNHDYPLLGIQLHIRLGDLHDPPDKSGLLNTTADMMLRGAGTLDRAAFSERVEALGGHLEIALTRESLVIDGEVLTRLSDEWFDLLELALFSPVFDAAELQRYVQQSASALSDLADSDEALGSIAYHRALLAPDPKSRCVKGTLSSLEQLTIDDLKACHETLIQRDRLLLGVCGNVTEGVRSRLRKLLEAIPQGRFIDSAPVDISKVDAFDIWLVDKPARTQCQLFLGTLAPVIGDMAYPGLTIGTTAFGGMFTSRFSQEIREKRGWSYAAWAAYTARADIGWWTLRCFPSTEHALRTLDVASTMVDQLVELGLTEAEHAFAVDTLVASFSFQVQTHKRRMEDTLLLRLLRRPHDAMSKWQETLRSTTLTTANACLRSLAWPKATCVMVGDADHLQSRLQGWSRSVSVRCTTPEKVLADIWE
ncbi:MAG: pitrilysin family protein [Myxococcota bacterium]|nr:pitrilysin family protein [Myxococcota bacterium]